MFEEESRHRNGEKGGKHRSEHGFSESPGIGIDVRRALRDGDHEAFRTVFMTYYGPIRKFLSSLVRSESMGEEIAQETFAALWINHEKIDPAKSIKGYLYTIARNNAFNYIAARKVRDHYPVGDTFDVASEGALSDEAYIARETELLIEIALSRMPQQRARIFRMSRNDGFNNEEIARQLGITKNAVERQISFAKRDIREILKLFILIFFLN